MPVFVNRANLLLSFLFLSFSLLLSACAYFSDIPNLKDYYYPIAQLKEGKVYEYTPANNDTLAGYYWYFHTLRPDPKQSDKAQSNYLTGTYYDVNYEIAQMVSEEVVSNGTILDEAYLFLSDNNGVKQQIKVAIDAANVFPFEVKDTNTVLFYKIHWKNPKDTTEQLTLTRNRRYRGKTTYSFKGHSYDCIQFELRELIDSEKEGHWQQEYKGQEFYAKGIGLVYSEKVINKNFVLAYRLKDIYDMKQLEEKAKNK
jgi:hypothetical protein